MLRSFEKNGCRPTLVRCFCIQLAALGDISLMFSVLCRNISEGAHYSIMAAAITIIDIAAELIVDQRGGGLHHILFQSTQKIPRQKTPSQLRLSNIIPVCLVLLLGLCSTGGKYEKNIGGL